MKKARYIALGTVVLLTLLLLKLPSQTATRVKLAVGSVFLPLFGVVSSGQEMADKAADALTSRRALLADNQNLRRENQELRIQAMQSAELARENERLRQQFGFTRKQPWKARLAHVIARDPANWWRQIHIDLGQRHGVRPDLPVLTGEGLVGRVAEVAETRSRVILLGDPNCRVGAFVPEAKENGIISSGGVVMEGAFVELGHLSRSDALKPGQLVETSGLGGVFPKGIPIGHIVDFRSVEFGLYAEARVKLAVNLNSLEEVWVLLP